MYPDYISRYPELGFYGLPGHSRTPRDILDQARAAEELGVGNIMISERLDYKEIASICGAVAAVTDEIFIGTSGTNLNTRHPLVTASIGSTLNRLSEGRFALGLAKGVKFRWQNLGLPFPGYAREEQFVHVMRRLWQGETVSDAGGPLRLKGRLSLAPYLDEKIPLLYVGFGLKSLRHAGRLYDGVHLHTFMSDRALSDAVSQVRRGEADAGREPGSVKVWSVLATACEVSEEKYLKYIIARLATYLQISGYGEALVRINGWEPELLERFRKAQAVTSVGGMIDSVATPAQLSRIADLIPDSWRPAATGDARSCAERWQSQFRAGADGIIIHASGPDEFAPVLEEYASIRPSQLFHGRTNRPGC